jgi:hypothetical protein
MGYINTILIGGQYEDPTEWNGTNPNCLLCEKEIELMDEYCEDHQRCYYCGEREVCEEDCPKYETEELN